MRGAVLQDAVRAFARNPAGFFKLLRSLPTVIRLYWRLFWDRRTGWVPRTLLLATLGYVISPIDLVPAALFGLIGTLDDLTVLIFGCRAFLRAVPPPVVDEHLAALARDGAASRS